MADRVTDSTASIRRGLNQHGCERIVLPSHIRVQSTKLTDISFVAYTDGLCPLCMVYAQILGEHPEYLRDISHIDRTRQTILEEKYRNVFRKMNVTYISGPTGVGKTRSVREGCGYANCYSVSDYKHPFDGYRGQAAILFDEFHGNLPLVNMLQYLDGYPLELPCRYANKQACYTEV